MSRSQTAVMATQYAQAESVRLVLDDAEEVEAERHSVVQVTGSAHSAR
jgi:hypothetical protein